MIKSRYFYCGFLAGILWLAACLLAVHPALADDYHHQYIERYAYERCSGFFGSNDGEIVCKTGLRESLYRVYAACLTQKNTHRVKACLDRHIPKGEQQ